MPWPAWTAPRSFTARATASALTRSKSSSAGIRAASEPKPDLRLVPIVCQRLGSYRTGGRLRTHPDARVRDQCRLTPPVAVGGRARGRHTRIDAYHPLLELQSGRDLLRRRSRDHFVVERLLRRHLDPVGPGESVELVGLGETTVVACFGQGVRQHVRFQTSAVRETQPPTADDADRRAGRSRGCERLDLAVVHPHRSDAPRPTITSSDLATTSARPTPDGPRSRALGERAAVRPRASPVISGSRHRHVRYRERHARGLPGESSQVRTHGHDVGEHPLHGRCDGHLTDRLGPQPPRSRIPSTPTDRSPEVGFTPECSPDSSWTSRPSPTAAWICSTLSTPGVGIRTCGPTPGALWWLIRTAEPVDVVPRQRAV